MTVLAPWLVAVAVGLALVPVALHLIARRPPSRAPLPTARFLRAESRSRIHLDRRPTDLALMALRAAFMLVLVSALAGPTWSRRSGTVDLVLADATTDPTALADSLARFADARVLRFDTMVDATGRSQALPDYGSALRAARALAPHLGADSVRLRLITTPRWAGWTPGTAAARQSWPGPIGIVPVPAARVDALPPVVPVARVLADDPAPIVRALLAAGMEVSDSGATIVFVLGGADPSPMLADGATVVAIDASADSGMPPVHVGPLTLDLPGGSPAGAGGRVLAAWHDGAPAASATPRDGGCLVTSGIDLRDRAVQASPDFPALLARLASGCTAPPDALADVPLDAGALAMLAGGGGPAAAAVPAGGVPLGRWFLLLALLLALAETALVARRGTWRARAGTSAT